MQTSMNRAKHRAAVAQWIEYWPPKPRVVGSIPASRTTSNWLAIFNGDQIALISKTQGQKTETKTAQTLHLQR
jgi:hypothetical protein